LIYFSREEVEQIGMAGSCAWWDGNDRLAYRFLSNFWLYVEEGDTAFTPHGPEGFWEAWITTWMSRQFDSHDIFVDVGANVGYYTLMAAKHGISTLSFEPIPEVFGILRDNVKINRATSKTTCQNYAVSDEIGTARLMIPEGHTGAACLSDEGIPVKTTTLDHYLSFFDYKKALIKVDVEGAEPKVWRGMQEVLRRGKVTMILEWDVARWGLEGSTEFAKELFTLPYVGWVDAMGRECEYDHPEQLLEIEGIDMVLVKNWR
jgi:FkbM family methyltransferase